MWAIDGNIMKKSDADLPVELEVLSYPIARMIVSCIGDDDLIHRYAIAEAKAAYKALIREPQSVVVAVGLEVGMNVSMVEQKYRLNFNKN